MCQEDVTEDILSPLTQSIKTNSFESQESDPQINQQT